MSLKIQYLKTKNKPSSNIVLFTDDNFNINKLKRHLSNHEFLYVNDLLKASDLKKNLLVFELSSKKKIVLVSIKKKSKSSEIESLGAEFYNRINYGKSTEYFIISDSLEVACGKNQSLKILEIQRQGKNPQKIGEFTLGSKITKGSIIPNV